MPFFEGLPEAHPDGVGPYFSFARRGLRARVPGPWSALYRRPHTRVTSSKSQG